MCYKKTIWYLNHYAPSASLPKKGRSFYLLNEVAKQGYNVAVVGASRHHLVDDNPQIDRFAFQKVDELLFGWIRTPSYYGNGLKRILNMLSYSWQLLLLGGAIPKTHAYPDIIVVSSVHPLHYPIAFYLAKRYGAKIIFEVRDIWPLTLHDLVGLPRWHPFYLLLAAIERLAYRSADRVISLMQNGLQHMGPRGLSMDRFRYIPNGVGISAVSECVNLEYEAELLMIKNSYDFVIMYTGAHGVPNALDQLLSAAAILQFKGEPIAIVLVGDGVDKHKLVNRSISEELANVYFLSSVPPDQVPCLLEYAHAGFVGSQNKSIYQYGISPNKMFEYMKSRTPVIQCIDSPGSPVELSGCGIQVTPGNPEKLVEAILSLSKLSSEELTSMGEKGRTYVLEKHSYSRLALKFVEACND